MIAFVHCFSDSRVLTRELLTLLHLESTEDVRGGRLYIPLRGRQRETLSADNHHFWKLEMCILYLYFFKAIMSYPFYVLCRYIHICGEKFNHKKTFNFNYSPYSQLDTSEWQVILDYFGDHSMTRHFLYFFLSKLIPPISRHICKYLGFLFYLTWDTRCKIFLFKRFFVEYDFIIIWETISFLSSMRIFFIFHKTEKQKTYCYIILKYYIYLVPNM